MLAPATVLQDRYRVVRIIGHGGMGAVYEAVDLRLGSTVALKQTLFSDGELSRAFEREARLLASLHHPALPRVSDHFVDGDGQFIVMEFIPGDDLARMLKLTARPFECGRVLQWANQLLDALDYLHSHRPPVIHRDIKPQNLKLTGADQIVLLDFGLAKGEPQLLDPATASSVFGYTLNYAPLEQIQKKGTDARSDLYSVGATLYQLLTAAVPPGSLSRAAAIVSGEGDPLLAASVVNREVSPAIAQMINKAMALRADYRFDSAAGMRLALGEASWRPSTRHPIFGQVAARAASTTRGPEGAVFRSEPGIDLYEAPTRPLMVPKRTLAPDTVPITSRPEPQSTVINPAQRSPWIWFLASVLTLLVFLTVFWTARLGESDPPPPPKFGTSQADPPKPPPPLLPGTELPMNPPIIVPPPAAAIRLDEVVWHENGTVTLHWSPFPGAVRYRLERANGDFSKIRVLSDSAESVHTVSAPSSGATGYVRLTAIFADGHEVSGQWFPITREQPPNGH